MSTRVMTLLAINHFRHTMCSFGCSGKNFNSQLMIAEDYGHIFTKSKQKISSSPCIPFKSNFSIHIISLFTYSQLNIEDFDLQRGRNLCQYEIINIYGLKILFSVHLIFSCSSNCGINSMDILFSGAFKFSIHKLSKRKN